MSMSDPAMAAGMERDIRRRFIVALLLTVPVAVLAGHVPGIPMLVHPPLSSWIGLALATPVVWWCGWIFHAGTVSALRNRSLDMSVLISTGVLAAYFSSVYLTIIGYPTAYYEAATMLVTFVLFGHWMEMKSRRGTSDALRALFDLTPPTARVLRSGAESEIPTANVIVGDTIVVRPGRHRHCDRRRYRRRDRGRDRRVDAIRSRGYRPRDPPEQSDGAKDETESRMGERVQPARDSGRGRCLLLALRLVAASGDFRAAYVGVVDRRRAQRRLAAAGENLIAGRSCYGFTTRYSHASP